MKEKGLAVFLLLAIPLVLMPPAQALPPANDNTTIAGFSVEYQPGEHGRVIIQLLNSTGDPQNSASCHSTIYYPNNSVLSGGAMAHIPASHAAYNYSFTVPSELGVYAAVINCTGPEAYGLAQFHVSPWALDIEDLNSTLYPAIESLVASEISGAVEELEATIKSNTKDLNEAMDWWGNFYRSWVFHLLLLVIVLLVLALVVLGLRKRRGGGYG